MRLDDDMRRVVEEQRLAFVATVSADGTPNVSPKGTIAPWGEGELVFLDLHSPTTVANIASRPAVEINVVDPIARRGYRFKGVGTVATSGPAFEEVVVWFERERGLDRARVHAVVRVRVAEAAPVISPAYDGGTPEQEIVGRWRDHHIALADRRLAALAAARPFPPPLEEAPAPGAPVVDMSAAALRAEGGATIVGPVDWLVHAGERWVVLGANGSGKTSLLRLAGAERRPTSGSVRVLGQRFGRVDLRRLRARIGVASAAIADQLRPTLLAHDAVLTARHGALEPWWHDYADDDHRRADTLLELMGCGALGDRQLATLSQGERQRVLLARALMNEPELLLLDEPAAGLDLLAREELVGRIEALARDPGAPAMVLVTHHVEEIPGGMTHALLMAAGGVVASGPVGEVLTGDAMSSAYGLPIAIERRGGRWTARATRRS